MYEVKPGKWPSIFSAFLAVTGGIFILAALIAWASGSGDAMLVIFGIWFGVVLIAVMAYALYMAFARDRPTMYEITAGHEERDGAAKKEEGDAGGRFCPYCGASLKSKFRFCPACGKEVHGSS
jgi:membrane protease subunit (stomatin/prohibitin family)